ncbi:L,D-transpeptidase [Neoaquamicrobium sediminum]|nr:L,D-transpeptidase [Rhizobiaceae bacterium]NRC56401.1 L,D-transpeptidase [Mesorhizobium sediminum]
MINRRSFMACMAAAIPVVPRPAAAHIPSEPFEVDPEYVPQEVAFPSGYAAGTIVIDTAERFLYFVEEEGRARRYGIGVGRAGLAWSGTAEVGRKARWPSWTPTPNMIRREPGKYAKYADGVPGGPSNPLGSRALYLYRNGRDTYYRIHGTTEPWTIGKAVSNGCIRLINEHVEDLYERVTVGATVIVLHGKELLSGSGGAGSN